ncbi:MAG: hypothetical protein KAT10_00025, partial [Sulfurimonas sp.]|nr:hypothetical protein [Sulfurimonas sp.]
ESTTDAVSEATTDAVEEQTTDEDTTDAIEEVINTPSSTDLSMTGEGEVDFATIEEDMRGLDTINLNSGAQDLTIALEDVLETADDSGNIDIKIEGDDTDTIHLNDEEFVLGETIELDDTSYDVYSSVADETVTLTIDTQIDVDVS